MARTVATKIWPLELALVAPRETPERREMRIRTATDAPSESSAGAPRASKSEVDGGCFRASLRGHLGLEDLVQRQKRGSLPYTDKDPRRQQPAFASPPLQSRGEDTMGKLAKKNLPENPKTRVGRRARTVVQMVLRLGSGTAKP